MATINTFEDVEAWKLARELCKIIHEIASTTNLKDDFGLKNQIRNSSGSIMDNIAEGFERGGRKEFIQFLAYAKGSCGETRSQIYRIADNGYIDEHLFNSLLMQATEISKKLSGFIKYLNTSNIEGSKFRTSEKPQQH